MTAYCAALLAAFTTALLSILKLFGQRHYCARVNKLVILHKHTSQFTRINPSRCSRFAVQDYLNVDMTFFLNHKKGKVLNQTREQMKYCRNFAPCSGLWNNKDTELRTEKSYI